MTGTTQNSSTTTSVDSLERRVVRVGYLPLTDCAPLIVAAALGFDRQFGIEIQLSREASWAAVRDKLVGGTLNAAQMLYGQAYGIELGIAGPRHAMAVLMTLNQNGQAITLGNVLRKCGVRSGDDLARYLLRTDERPHFAHTYPTGTHALWLNYWLAAHDIDPLAAVRTSTVPPVAMVDRLRAGEIDGYCAGEPWNARALSAGAGFTVATSQSIWPGHPEKALATTDEFVRECPHTAQALVMAVLAACRHLDQPRQRDQAAALLAAPGCLGLPAPLIAGRLNGEYFDGLGAFWRDPHAVRFHDEGRVNFPYWSDGMWFLTQFRRWGLLRDEPDYLACAQRVNRTALYSAAADALGVELPTSPMRTSRLFDGRVWDGSEPSGYAHSFARAYRSATAALA